MQSPLHKLPLAMLLLGMVMFSACVQAEEPAPLRVVDLSHVVQGNIPYPPSETITTIERAADGSVRSLTIGLRSGTTAVVVAGSDSAPTVDLLSPQDLVLPAVRIDLRDRLQDAEQATIELADLQQWEQAHGAISPGALVLFVTGWDLRWGDPAAYLNLDSGGNPVPPRLSAEAGEWLFAERAVLGLGFDSMIALPSLEHVSHWLLLENLTNVEQLPARGAQVTIGVLKLQAGSSAPARVLALAPASIDAP
jgi:kynurenine formamidase